MHKSQRSTCCRLPHPDRARSSTSSPTPPRATRTPRRSTTAPSQLTYSELLGDIEDSVAWLAARGIGRGDRIGIRMPSGSYALYVAILSVLAAGAAYVPGRCRRPRRARRTGVRRGRRRCASSPRPGCTAASARRGAGAPAAPLSRDDAWIIFTSGSTGTPEGRRRHPPQRRRLRRRRGADVPAGQPDRPRRPGAGRVVGGLRRLVRGDVAGLATRRLPGPGAALAGAQRHGPRARGWSSRDITVVSTVPTLAALWPAEALEAVRLLIFGGEACPPELAERLGPMRRPRGVEHLRPHRGHRRRVRGAARRHEPGPHRPAAAGLGPGRRRPRRAAGRATARSANW